MLALINNPKPFIILIFPRLAPPSLVLSEHFVLKDLLFYEIACLANFEARQARLEERERKRQEGTLRQAPIAVGDLAKIPPWIVLNNCQRRTLCPRGKMPQQSVSM